jgi:hypothetical protein
VFGSRRHARALLKAQCRALLSRTPHKPVPDWRRRPLCRAAGRTLAQAFLACEDYTSAYKLLDTWGATVSPGESNAQSRNMGQDVGRFFIVATSQVHYHVH